MSLEATRGGPIACGVMVLCALLLGSYLGATSAQANRAVITEKLLKTSESFPNPTPPPEGQIEGACGVALAPGGNLYVSDYYHHLVDVFSVDVLATAAVYAGTQFAVNPLNGVCGLAFDSAGNLYANEWHESVLRLKPTVQTFDSNESTGVAVDSAGNVYSNDRTFVAVYEPSGAPLLDGGQPLRIGLGSLGDAYGVAVDSTGRVFVPDASDNTVKVYQPSSDPLDPVATIDGSATPRQHFNSLVDAAVAVDPTNDHLLVLDNLQPGFEHPKATVYEFDSSGAFLGQLPGEPVHGEPSGLAVSPTGRLFVTTGNDEKANVFSYGPYTAPGSSSTPPPSETPDAASLPLSGGDQSQGWLDSPRSTALPALRHPLRRSRHRHHRLRRHARLWPAKVVSRR